MRPFVALFILLAVVGLVPLPAAGQAQKAGEDDGVAPRTAWGAPDLHGVWSSNTITPLQRPKGVTSAFLTEEEVAQAETKSVERAEDWDAGTDLWRAYDAHWFDFATSVVSTRQTSLIMDPEDGRMPALSPEAQQWVDSPEGQQRRADRAALGAGTLNVHGPENTSLWDRCLTLGVPMRPGAYNNNYQIFQSEDHLVILQEMIHESRIIPLDGRAHLPGDFHQWLGDGRGHWEGDTLVVETTNFSPKQRLPFGPGTGAEELRMIERFTRVEGGLLLYEFTLEDPTWTRPWTAVLPMPPTNGQIYEYACHEGNKGLYGILSSSRALERRAAKAAAK